MVLVVHTIHRISSRSWPRLVETSYTKPPPQGPLPPDQGSPPLHLFGCHMAPQILAVSLHWCPMTISLETWIPSPPMCILSHTPPHPGVEPQGHLGIARRRLQGAGCKVQAARCRVQGAGCRVQVAGCRMQDVGCRVYGVRCRVREDRVAQHEDARRTPPHH